MGRRKAERPAERGVRRAETNAVAAYLTALRAPKLPARSRDALQKRLIQQRLDIDAQLAQIEQAGRLPEMEEAFVNVAASWAKRSGITATALREVGVPASVLKRAGLLCAVRLSRSREAPRAAGADRAPGRWGLACSGSSGCGAVSPWPTAAMSRR